MATLKLAAVMVSLTVVVAVTPPPVPVIVIVELPVEVLAGTVTVMRSPLPTVSEFGIATVTPAGCPFVLKLTGVLKPLRNVGVTVMLVLVEPCTIDSVDADGLNVKLGFSTVRVMVV